MGDLIIYAGLFVCGAIALSFTIVVGFALYFAYRESADRKLYKSKFIQDNQLSMSGLPIPKYKPSRELNINSDPTYPRPPAPCPPPPKRSKKEPCCECGRPLSKYFED